MAMAHEYKKPSGEQPNHTTITIYDRGCKYKSTSNV